MCSSAHAIGRWLRMKMCVEYLKTKCLQLGRSCSCRRRRFFAVQEEGAPLVQEEDLLPVQEEDVLLVQEEDFLLVQEEGLVLAQEIFYCARKILSSRARSKYLIIQEKYFLLAQDKQQAQTGTNKH